jgi:hypothetical protein
VTRTAARRPAAELLASVERALAHHHLTGNIRSWRPQEDGHVIVASDMTEHRTRSLAGSRSYVLGLASAAKACAKRMYLRDQVDAAVHAASALLADTPGGLGLGERDSDLLDLHAAAVMHLLGDPDATLDQVIEQNYDGKTPAEVRGWWTRWGSARDPS